MKDLWNYLKKTKKPIVLYGMGNGADKILSVCKEKGINISGVFSSDAFVREKTFHGMRVTDYNTAKETFGDMTVLVAFGTQLPGVIENIKRISRECELYFPDVPVCGEELFDGEFYGSRKARFDKIYGILADEQSKKVFKNIVNFKLTGDINCLFGCETEDDEAYGSFLELSGAETYLDLGAYRGDTVLSFLERVTGYEGIIALEPDPKSYEKLLAATAHIYNIRCINAAAAEHCGSKPFNTGGSRGFGAACKTATVKTVSVDSLGVSPTYIKMDIEGDELSALSGAAETVRKLRPKMKIAAYHRTDDLVSIPEKVLSLCPDYKVYLRHTPCLPAWDVFYYFISA